MIQVLAQLADSLDKKGFLSEADLVDRIIEAYYQFNSNDLVWHKNFGVGKVAWCGEGTCEVIFRNDPRLLNANEVQGKTIFFEARPGDKVHSGFYRVLNKPIPFVIEKKEIDLEGKDHYRKMKIYTGTLRLSDFMGNKYTVEDYPLGRDFIGTTKIDPTYLQPYKR